MPKPLQRRVTFKGHVSRWSDCEACDLCNYRNKIVFARGKLPCDVLYIGEAPGDSEDCLGVPFVGPAGKLRDRIVRIALERTAEFAIGEYEDAESDLRYREAITNLVCCLPKEEGIKRDPRKAEIEACGNRLREFYRMARPQLVVTLGDLAKKWAPKILDLEGGVRTLSLIHPAAILRMEMEDRRRMAIQQCVIRLSDQLIELYGET